MLLCWSHIILTILYYFLHPREERDNTAALLLSKSKELESSEAVLADTQNQYAQALVDLQAAQEQEKKLQEAETALEDKIAKLSKESEKSENQQALIAKVWLTSIHKKRRHCIKMASSSAL